MSKGEFEYEVGLSFAGEQRGYVEQVAHELRSLGIRVFFDDYEKAELWGKDLYSHLDDIFQNRCTYCIIFVSEEYAKKVWPNAERESAQARALKENQEYILPVKFDSTPVPGLRDTIHFIDAMRTPPCEIADLTRQKLGRQLREEFLPPILDRLFERLGIEEDCKAQKSARQSAWSFLSSVRKMTYDEKQVILTVFRCGCPAALPENVHIDIDLLHRETGRSVASLKRNLGAVRSLGFTCSIRQSTGGDTCVDETVLGDCYMVDLTWENRSVDADWYYPEMLVAYEMVHGVTKHYCRKHGIDALERLDFSRLGSTMALEETQA